MKILLQLKNREKKVTTRQLLKLRQDAVSDSFSFS